MTRPNYSKLTRGEWKLTLPIVCDNGTIQTVRIEQYVEGFAFFLVTDNGDYSNHTCYKTATKAIHAAAQAAI